MEYSFPVNWKREHRYYLCAKPLLDTVFTQYNVRETDSESLKQKEKKKKNSGINTLGLGHEKHE